MPAPSRRPQPWRSLVAALVTLGALGLGALAAAAAFQPPSSNAPPIEYTLSLPEPQHRWLQVDAVFSNLGESPLRLRMSRSSPGRYALHEFAKNVFDLRVTGADGRELPTTRPDPYGWDVDGHRGTATVRYKVYGDRVDGTFLAIDPTHAHINMPAALIWARGLEERAATLSIKPPGGRTWRVATQLHPGRSPLQFTAPNLQYLMDSPLEASAFFARAFTVGDRAYRLALHHGGSDAELDPIVSDVTRIVTATGDVFREYPVFEPGYYTFIVDYLPYAGADAMEHRNSTVISAPASVAGSRGMLLESIAHEFFHAWNVERIRPRSLEPFDFDRANLSGELWLAEGFTEYYSALVLSRAGLTTFGETVRAVGAFVGSVASRPQRELPRSPVDMSYMAAFTDGTRPADPTNFASTVISYYPLGGAMALALDLSLRERSAGRITLDDFMRAMWRVHGRPGGTREGYVDRPYTLADAETRLAEVSGDAAFARDFFSRYVTGRQVPDFARLLAQAGVVVRPRHEGEAWWGDFEVDVKGRTAQVTTAPAIGTPAYLAGLNVDDELLQLDGVRLDGRDPLTIVRRRRPADVIPVVFRDRAGIERTASITLAQNPAVDVVPLELSGAALSAAQRQFRREWLEGTKKDR